MADAPKAPWSPFPLTELVVLLAMALIVAGVLTDGGRRGALLGCGFALVSLAGLELALREHFAGYRSHSTLLAGASAIVVVAPLFLWTGLPQIALLAIGAGVFVLLLMRLRRAFRARSGGVGFRA
jgi:tetrahydromethanopterin S-methyltransferase subunit C